MLINNLFKRLEKEWDFLESHDQSQAAKKPYHEILKSFNPVFKLLSNKNIDSKNHEFRYYVEFDFENESDLENQHKNLYKGINFTLEKIKNNKYQCILKSKENNRIQFSFLLAYLFIELQKSDFNKALSDTIKYLKNHWSLNELSEHFQLGLFGELYILEWFIKYFGWKNAIQYWDGPDSGLHDFVFNNSLVEVKTTKSDPPSIKIDKPEQLFKPESKNLFLNVCFATTGEGINLTDKVDRLINNYPDYNDAKSEFERKLMRVGFFNHLLTPSLIKIKINQSKYAHINQSDMTFPKKVYDSLPVAVENVQYHLNFTALESKPTHLEDWI